MNSGAVHVWPLVLAELADASLPASTAGERARASKFRMAEQTRAYLLAHRALRAILRRYTKARLNFAVSSTGKPYLPGAPEVRFNLARSGGMALVAVGLDVEVGADIERVRALNDYAAIAEHYFPPGEAAGLTEVAEQNREHEFFRRWTRIEAVLKARGDGLYGLGSEIDDNWTIAEIPVPENYTAAVAAPVRGLAVVTHRWNE